MLEGYRHYLASERGLSGPEVTRHVQTAGMFAEHARAADRGWAAVTAADVTGFAVAQCAALGRASACKRISQLRSFLRFAHLSGLTAAALAPAVPPAAWWSTSSLPRWLPPGQVAALLAACDQRTARGRRDFAIVTLLSRLGLRAGEVAAMQLDDIDWRTGTLTVRGKARREEKMPLLMTLAESPQSCSAEFPTLLGIRLRVLRLVCPFFFGPVFGVCDTALTTVGELAARAARVSGRPAVVPVNPARMRIRAGFTGMVAGVRSLARQWLRRGWPRPGRVTGRPCCRSCEAR